MSKDNTGDPVFETEANLISEKEKQKSEEKFPNLTKAKEKFRKTLIMNTHNRFDDLEKMKIMNEHNHHIKDYLNDIKNKNDNKKNQNSTWNSKDKQNLIGILTKNFYCLFIFYLFFNLKVFYHFDFG